MVTIWDVTIRNRGLRIFQVDDASEKSATIGAPEWQQALSPLTCLVGYWALCLLKVWG